MPRFLLIDHSLKGVGGHHYEYALHVARAAEAAGYQPVLAAHRRFRDRGLMGAGWQLFTPYHQSTYTDHSILGNLPKWRARRSLAQRRRSRFVPRRVLDLVDHWHVQWFEWRRARAAVSRSAAFEHGTRDLFRVLSLTPGDQVFIPTLNEIDLLGLVRYLKSDPSSRLAQWHLQFHYDIDPEGDAAAQEDSFRGRLREIFGQCHELLATHRLNFYTTTGQLAQQYNRLGTVHFRGLPYPVNPAIQSPDRQRQPHAPLLATCLGGVRDEKGLQFLSGILDQLWPDYFATGRLQLAVQAERTGKLPAAVRRRLGRSHDESAEMSPLRVVPHPLNSEAYVRLLQQSKIGLLMYDRRQYLNRCSGVLVEMLTAGVPVIVPAGCWLADQLAEEIHRHHERMRDELPVVETLTGRPKQEIAIPQGATHLLVTFRWSSSDRAATSAQLEVRQSNRQENLLHVERSMAGHRAAGRPATALVPLVEGARHVHCNWQSAYRDAPLEIRDVQLDFLSAAAVGGSCPLGAVGLIAAEPGQVPSLLRNLVDHYSHYQQTAGEFAQRWIQWHNPDRVVAELLYDSHLVPAAA